MPLFERIAGTVEPKIPVHALMAAIAEYERGVVTAQQVFSAFGLDASEQMELANLVTKLVGQWTALSFGSVVQLTNVGAAYDATVASRNIGYAYVEVAGIDQVLASVRVNKIGAGVQSWQLWNDSGASSVAVMQDAGAAGERELTTTVDLPAPLAPGVMRLRWRAMSTVAADDPWFYGGALLFRRRARLTSVELHEIFLLAEGGFYTPAVTRSRLGL